MIRAGRHRARSTAKRSQENRGRILESRDVSARLFQFAAKARGVGKLFSVISAKPGGYTTAATRILLFGGSRVNARESTGADESSAFFLPLPRSPFACNDSSETCTIHQYPKILTFTARRRDFPGIIFLGEGYTAHPPPPPPLHRFSTHTYGLLIKNSISRSRFAPTRRRVSRPKTQRLSPFPPVRFAHPLASPLPRWST